MGMGKGCRGRRGVGKTWDKSKSKSKGEEQGNTGQQAGQEVGTSLCRKTGTVITTCERHGQHLWHATHWTCAASAALTVGPTQAVACCLPSEVLNPYFY